MKRLFREWLDFARILVIPAFLFVCCDFLYRLSEMNVLKDAVLSFAFLELISVFLASCAAFLLVWIGRGLRLKHVHTIVGFTAAFCSLFVLFFYLKVWVFSFTFADERRLIVVKYYYLMGLAFALALAGIRLIAKKRGLSRVLEEAKRRHGFLVAAASLCSLFLLSYGIFAHTSKAEAKADAAGGHADASARSNVLILVVDTLSASALSSYGHQNSTPFLERLAKESYFFANARANATVTGPSLASLFTGRSPLKSHILGFHAVPAHAEKRNLFTLFEEAGYHTESMVQSTYAAAYFLGFPSLTGGETQLHHDPLSNHLNRWLSKLCRRLGFSLKFRLRNLFGKPAQQFSTDFERIAKRLQDLSSQEKPFFLYAHLFLPKYVPYDFGADTDPVAFKGAYYCNFYPPEVQAKIDLARKAYWRTVSDLDRHLSDFLESLKEEGVLDKTVVVITADHGDSYARGFWGHGHDLSEDSIRVPLYIIAPSRKNEIVEHPVQLCDVAPTILSLNRMEIPDWMDCLPALPVSPVSPVSKETKKRQVAVTFNFLTSEESIRSKIAYPGLSSGHSIALYDSGYKYILHPRGKPGELYDLQRDPAETENLQSRLPDKSKALETKLLGLLENP